MKHDWNLILVAILIQRLGGSVTITREELVTYEPLQLFRSDDSFGGDIKFTVEDGQLIQGEIV